MKKNILKVVVPCLVAAVIALAPSRVFSQDDKDKKPAGESEDAVKPKRDILPFRGTIAAIDKDAKTFTVGSRTFQVSADTKIERAGNPAKLEDGVVGERVTGSCKKTEDGGWIAMSVYLGGKQQ
jgi:Domain of unknown function (DUF5666)